MTVVSHNSGDSRETRRLYSEHEPHRRIPSHKLFTELVLRLNESVSFAPRASDRERSRSLSILRRAEGDLGTSVQRTAELENCP
jgi:hypothetical protein